MASSPNVTRWSRCPRVSPTQNNAGGSLQLSGGGSAFPFSGPFPSPHPLLNRRKGDASGKSGSALFLTWEDLWVFVSGRKGDRVPVLLGLTGLVQPGEVLAIMGPSGCGKSTLLDSLAAWFFKWWNYFGAELNIIPDLIKEIFNEWMEAAPKMRVINPRKMIQGQNLAHFFTDCPIPWIWSWNVIIRKNHFNQLVLQRQFILKWWNSISIEDKLKQAKIIIKIYSELTVSQNPTDFELSVDDVLQSIKRRYFHENEVQHKERLKKIYENQLAKVFNHHIYICDSGDSPDGVDVKFTGEINTAKLLFPL